MKTYLLNLDGKLLRIIREIGREADRRRVSVYIAGGIVRDIILKRKNLDLDVIVERDAVRLAKTLSRKWKARLTVHARFGTACLELPRGVRVDLATARKERYTHPGALPAVWPGDLEEDLFRRDFTINAMAIAINPGHFGQLIDRFGGLRDLSGKKIRILHDQSFIDDPTRILRAVRFEQRFLFQIERRTLSLIKTALLGKAVITVKPPRYFAEFKKMLCEPDPLKCLKRLHHLGGLRFLGLRAEVPFRELSLMYHRIQKVRQKPLYRSLDSAHGVMPVGLVRDSAPRAEARGAPQSCWRLVYFMGITAKVNDGAMEDLLAKFHFTKNERTSIRQSSKAGGILKSLSTQHLLPSQIYQILKPLTREVILYLRVRTSKIRVCRRIDRFLDEDINAKLQINGEDLKRFGITSGREMGKVLGDVLCLKIDKRVRTKQEELNAALLSLGKY